MIKPFELQASAARRIRERHLELARLLERIIRRSMMSASTERITVELKTHADPCSGSSSTIA